MANKYLQMVIIILIFSFIHMTITLSIGISHVKKNWESYKCNPLIMPFAGIFGKDPFQTSKDCMQTVQIDFMSAFLDPIYKSLYSMVSFGNEFGQLFDGLKGMANFGQLLSLDVFSDMQGRVSAIGGGFGNTMTDFNQALNGAFSLLTTTQYSIASLVGTADVASNELLGTILSIIMSF